MSYIKELKRQVKAEAKAYKRFTKEHHTESSMVKQIESERKMANRVYRDEVRKLYRSVKSESAALKALLN